jgi:hypothetical protein
VAFSLNLNQAMNEVVTTINEIEEIRKELAELVVMKRTMENFNPKSRNWKPKYPEGRR